MDKVKSKITYQDAQNIYRLFSGTMRFLREWEEVFGVSKESIIEWFASAWYENKVLYPDPYYLFAGLDNNPEETFAWVVGQDPYPNGEGIGYAFAIADTISEDKQPKSFKILDAAFRKHRIKLDNYLMPWRMANINSINIMPIVKPGQPNSFPELKKLMAFLVKNHADKYNVPVFAFGNVAYEALRQIGVRDVIKLTHPAARTLTPDNYDISPLINFIKHHVEITEDLTDRTIEQIYEDYGTSYSEEQVFQTLYVYELDGKKYIMESKVSHWKNVV